MNKLPVYTVVNKTEGIMTHFNDDGVCEAWEDLKNEMYSLGFGEAIGMSAEHGEGLSDLFEILAPHGQLLNLKKAEDKAKYEAYLKKKEMISQNQSYEIRTNIDPVIHIWEFHS